MSEVKCPSCGGVFHEVNEHYDPDQVAHGGMFVLKKKYREYGWSTFPADAALRFADLECPWCGGCYVDGTGRLIHPPVLSISASAEIDLSDVIPKSIDEARVKVDVSVSQTYGKTKVERKGRGKKDGPQAAKKARATKAKRAPQGKK